MKRVPANRFVVFFLIAGAGFCWDLCSKNLVFDDLGYPRGGNPVQFANGEHLLFDHPPGTEGRSVAYLNEWTTFRLFTSFNEGALWGLGQGLTWLFAVLSIVAIVGVVCWLFVYGAAKSWWLTVTLALIAGGTLGNLWDRLGAPGYVDFQSEPIHAVRDFMLFTFGGWPWPVFNFADVFLVTGAVMLVLQSFRATETV